MPDRPNLKKSYPQYLANRPVTANTDLEVRDEYAGKVATPVAMADSAAIAGDRRRRRDDAANGRDGALRAPGRPGPLHPAFP